MFEKECVPFAPSLIESMRSLGYSFPSAIADLIDNSISANAKQIEIFVEPSENPSLIILDNGHGMSDVELQEAMRYGSKNPLEERNGSDLGRFGLGLKSASLSQCRKLVVVSKKAGIISCYAWDLDFVVKKGAWILQGFEFNEIEHIPYVTKLLDMKSGTIVFLSEFDRIKESTNDLQKTLNKCLDDMIEHLALVFHRYLDDGVSILVNNLKIEPKDPFLLDNPATQIKRTNSFMINGEQIVLKPYILPHLSKLSATDIDKVGGKDRIRSEQGFYVYRNRRLIIWGTWFRLERKDELNKLARVMVDIPNSLDYMWSIDIKKSSATLPDIIKKNMISAVYESVVSSEVVHTFRGRKVNVNREIDYIWERLELRECVQYKINRNIPQIRMLGETLNSDQKSIFGNILRAIEDAFPMNALYVDVAKGRTKEKVDNEDFELWEKLKVDIEYAKKNKMPIVMYCNAFMKLEPYCNSQYVKGKLAEVIREYE